MNKVQSSNQSFSKLPSEVVWDILCRLPIKSCLCCKLVCKDWYDIIISPCFADLRRSYCPTRVTLIMKSRFPNGRLHFLMLELEKESGNVDHMGKIRVGPDCLIKFKSTFGTPNGQLSIANVCNGLVCLKADNKWACYHICNFLTSRFLTIEQSQPRSYGLHRYVLGSCSMKKTTQCGSRLGMVCGDQNVGSFIPMSREVDFEASCPLTHQYKVLRIFQAQNRKFMAEILTVGSDKWRHIDDAPTSCYNFQAFLNDSFHWCDYQDREFKIWAFHFGTEKFVRIPTPDEFKMRHQCALTVFDSCLCFCGVYGDNSTESEVWLMKEYGVGHSWVRQFVMHVREPLWLPFKPLLRVDNGVMLVKCGNSYLKLYDPETKTCKYVNVDGAFNIRRLEACDAEFSWMLGGVQGD